MVSESTFGARFVHEIRRLMNSTWGLTYSDLQQLNQMEQADFLRALGSRLAPFGATWLEEHASSSPERLAQAIVQEGQRRAAEGAGRQWEPDVGGLLLDLLLFLGK
jgi:hypothetical protein